MLRALDGNRGITLMFGTPYLRHLIISSHLYMSIVKILNLRKYKSNLIQCILIYRYLKCSSVLTCQAS